MSQNDPRPEVSRSRYVTITLVVIVASVIVGGLGVSLVDRYVDAQRSNVSTPEPFVPRVRALRIELRKVPVTIEGTGFLRSPATIRVPVETSGKLLQKHCEEGDVVTKGDLLAEIDSQVWRRRVDAAEAREVSVKAQLEYVDKELAREAVLAERGSGRLADQDRWISEKRRLDAALLENAAGLAESKMFLEKCKIVAARGGIWYEDSARAGEYLNAGQTFGLLRVVGRLELEVEVPGYARLALRADDAVDVDLLDVDETLTDVPARVEKCVIRHLPAGNNVVSRRFPVVVDVPNASRALVPGLFARVRFTLPREDAILLAPKEAVFDHYGRKALYVVETDSAGRTRAGVRLIAVRKLSDEPGYWLVEEGLASGDVIVLSPLEQLGPGLEISIEETVRGAGK